jgi:hypothetical protein
MSLVIIQGTFTFQSLPFSFSFTATVSAGVVIAIGNTEVTYGADQRPGTIYYVSPGDSNNGLTPPTPNDNNISLSTPFFTLGGLSFIDESGLLGLGYITYTIYTPDNLNYFIYGTSGIGTESVTIILNPCLFYDTNILTDCGQKLISEIKKGDLVVCNTQGDTAKVKKVIISDFYDIQLPILIPKGKLNADKDLILSIGHAVNNDGQWDSACKFGCGHISIEELKIRGYNTTKSETDDHNYPGIKYYHLELEIPESEILKPHNRRRYILIANGVIVESYSTELI